MLNRRTLLTGTAAVAALSAFNRHVFAKAPQVGAQTAPIHRVKVGDIEVTAVGDGFIDLPLEIFPAAKPDEAGPLLGKAFVPTGPMRTWVNAYAVNTGDRLILIDSGSGKAMGPTMGELTKNLGIAGIDPKAVDMVILTHMHGDHVAGLRAADKTAAFPNAEIVVRDNEFAFWTDEAIASRAPKDAQPFFTMARDAMEPYKGKVRRFDKDGEVTKGITAIHAPGHTVGHTLYRIDSGSASLLMFADVVHAAALQFAKPEWSMVFDTDQNQAMTTRKRVLDMAAVDRVLVAGSHLPFPAMGHVVKDGAAYAYVPAAWAPTL